MRYKVIITVNTAAAGNADSCVSFTFYTRAQAEQACEAYRAQYNNAAFLWDGSTWTRFDPIP